MHYIYIILFLSLQSYFLFASESPNPDNSVGSWYDYNGTGESPILNMRGNGLGEFGFPSNPMNDRAIGFLLKGKAKTAITNYGEFIEWDVHPAGLWGDYTYLPDVCFIAGVPGQSYTYRYEWFNSESLSDGDFCPEYLGEEADVTLWCSSSAYQDQLGTEPGFSWYEVGDTNFAGVIFENYLDHVGTVGEEKPCNWIQTGGDIETGYWDCNYADITDESQWMLDHDNDVLIISLPSDGDFVVNPNNSNVYGDPNVKKGVGLIYPWALRPALSQRLDDFDLYEYGDDGDAWTDDDTYDYYGANVAESWFTRWNPSSNTDWQPTTGSRLNTHATEVDAGDIFGNEVYVSESSTYPLLAHSEVVDTWPQGFLEDGTLGPVWPGGYAESYSPETTNCFPAKRWNDDCWIETNRFISNQDVYMEFDDRWAHRGSQVNDNVYESMGYPMGLHIMATAHSYSVAFAEDIMFVTVDVRNESGDGWIAFEKNRYGDKVYVTDSNGALISGDAMIMPDGTKLNNGKGFTYRDISMGFYMDADVVSTDIYGNFGVHTNDDDFMEYYDCANPEIEPDGCQVINDDTLRVSIAMIYDYNNQSGVASDIGYVGTQLLDSPYASEPVDLTGNGYPDIRVGDKLKMTDWHWFDWYNRPGVVYREGEAGCCAGDPNTAQAINKEEIQYKIMAGDTTNLSDNERFWFFHTDDPSSDNQEDPNIFNPHFDSLEGLSLTSFFQDDPDGLDCVLEMTCGPFSLEVGEQVPFSFCIIFGQNKTDLIDNARFAQLMYNSHYQGYTEPDYPTFIEAGMDSIYNLYDAVDGRSIGQASTPYTNYTTHDKGQIKLVWNDIAEKSTDVVTGYADFAGYKIYKSTDGGATWGGPTDKIYDNQGTHVGWKPYAQFHLTAQEDANHCVYYGGIDGEIIDYDCVIDDTEGVGYPGQEAACETIGGIWDCDSTDADICSCFVESEEDCMNINTLGISGLSATWTAVYLDCDDYGGTRGMNVCGDDIHTPWFSLGDCDDNTGIVNEFIDTDVLDGLEYTYSITAYDMGIAPDYVLGYNETLGILDTTYSSANPLHFATPDGYQHIETGKGTSVNDKNFITVKPGPQASETLGNDIKVVPNPYIVSSMYNETEYRRQIRFTNLPKSCKVTIYTVSGEKVVSFDKGQYNNHADCGDEFSGSCFWDMRSVNNQEVAPGLYIFTVEDTSEGNENNKFVGKFAVVR
tara:strand:- start:20 stop:3643 length:3624 start_codon:yes stop_codon:yes gene_type:complete